MIMTKMCFTRDDMVISDQRNRMTHNAMDGQPTAKWCECWKSWCRWKTRPTKYTYTYRHTEIISHNGEKNKKRFRVWYYTFIVFNVSVSPSITNCICIVVFLLVIKIKLQTDWNSVDENPRCDVRFAISVRCARFLNGNNAIYQVSIKAIKSTNKPHCNEFKTDSFFHKFYDRIFNRKCLFVFCVRLRSFLRFH